MKKIVLVLVLVLVVATLFILKGCGKDDLAKIDSRVDKLEEEYLNGELTTEEYENLLNEMYNRVKYLEKVHDGDENYSARCIILCIKINGLLIDLL